MSNLEPPAADLLKKRLIEILAATQSALKALESQALPELKVPKWSCAKCGYIKHFTKPACAKTAEGCPKCNGREFVPVTD